MHITLDDPSLVLDQDGTLRVKNAEVVRKKGIRLCREPQTATGDIGLSEGWDRPGCRLPKEAKLPGVRFEEPVLIANGVDEEYVALRLWSCTLHAQSLVTRGGPPMDVLKVTRAGKPATLKFDISRFLGEELLEVVK